MCYGRSPMGRKAGTREKLPTKRAIGHRFSFSDDRLFDRLRLSPPHARRRAAERPRHVARRSGRWSDREGMIGGGLQMYLAHERRQVAAFGIDQAQQTTN